MGWADELQKINDWQNHLNSGKPIHGPYACGSSGTPPGSSEPSGDPGTSYGSYAPSSDPFASTTSSTSSTTAGSYSGGYSGRSYSGSGGGSWLTKIAVTFVALSIVAGIAGGEGDTDLRKAVLVNAAVETIPNMKVGSDDPAHIARANADFARAAQDGYRVLACTYDGMPSEWTQHQYRWLNAEPPYLRSENQPGWHPASRIGDPASGCPEYIEWQRKEGKVSGEYKGTEMRASPLVRTDRLSMGEVLMRASGDSAFRTRVYNDFERARREGYALESCTYERLPRDLDNPQYVWTDRRPEWMNRADLPEGHPGRDMMLSPGGCPPRALFSDTRYRFPDP